MPQRRVPGVIEHRDFKELLKSLEKWHQKELRSSRNTRLPEEPFLVWFYEISEIILMRVPRFTNSEDFSKYVWFLIKWHCKAHLTKRAPNSESQSLPKVSWCLFRIILSNDEKCLTVVYRGSTNIEILRIVEIFRKMASEGTSTV